MTGRKRDRGRASRAPDPATRRDEPGSPAAPGPRPAAPLARGAGGGGGTAGVPPPEGTPHREHKESGPFRERAEGARRTERTSGTEGTEGTPIGESAPRGGPSEGRETPAAPAPEMPRPREARPEDRAGEERTETQAGDRVEDLAGEMAEAVRRCPDVAALSLGPFGTVATYLPGVKVSGVAVRDGEIDIAIVARYGRPLPEIADEVRDAVAPLAGGRRVNVAIDDLELPETAAA
ncbi:hypothetical protein GCM10023259_011200 [Thermocatellispora tengchongensis]|uniref:hypothetical protein n=1 Tax=Thermocatellispora tengchongensis TaxID=1073253 RepID=UPI0031EF31B4